MSSARKLLFVTVLCVCFVLLPLPVRAGPELQTGEAVHVVASGESLWAIARKYDVTVAALQEANGIQDASKIAVGQRLVIPGSVTSEEGNGDQGGGSISEFNKIHLVTRGESLSGIAARYGTTAQALAKVNGIADPNYLFVGQRLLVPGDSEPFAHSGTGAETLLPFPFTAVELRPPRPIQGETVLVAVETSDDVALSGRFEGHEIKFLSEGKRHWGLIPIHPMADVGPYQAVIAAQGSGTKPTSVTAQLWVAAGNFDVENIVLPADRQSLLDRDLIVAERERLSEALAVTEDFPLWKGLFTLPLSDAVVSSEFGTRRSYNGGPASSYHEGLDFDADEGDPVVAVADGQVVMAEPLTVRGMAILLDHGMGLHTGYWHLSEIGVEVGQVVKAGDVIGKVGGTGLSTGPHLHWEVRVGEITVNPRQWTQQLFP